VICLTTRYLKSKSDVYAYFYRAYAKSRLGDLKGAIDDYTQAIGTKPSSANSYGNRANVRMLLGDKSGACNDYKTAASLGQVAIRDWIKSTDGNWC